MMDYVERQRFRQPWLWAILGPSILASTVGPVYGLYHSAARQSLAATRATLASVAVASLISLGILWLMFAAELCVTVQDDALVIRFFPFLRRRIRYEDIRSVAPRTYNPILEYGGWGVRFGPRGKAYNVSGSQGVQLELASGERLLLGSQHPDELAEAIRARLVR